MSHELTQRESGLVEFAFRADHGAPWHGLGQPIPTEHYHDVDHWRAQAGMDWRIQRSRVRFSSEQGDTHTWDDNHVLFRSDTKAPLGIVSDGYKVVQPKQVVEFFRDLIEAGGLELSAMGTIFGGRRFWATAKIGEASPAGVSDKVGGYLLLSTSADGSLATEARLTSIRVVCRNTLAIARGEGKAAIRISHRSVFDPERVKADMHLNRTAWDTFRRNITKLANVEVTKPHAEHLVASLFAGSEQPDAMRKVRESTRGYQKVLDLFNGQGKGSRLDGAQGTAWGLLNAFTEYADHHVSARTDENRFVSAQWGSNADLKSKVYETLLAL